MALIGTMTRISKADIIEAALFAADKPVPLKKLAEIAEVELAVAKQEVDILCEEKSRIGALQIVELSGGWQIVTKPQFATYIRRLRDVPKQRMSRAAFEVLAIVAYRQPVTRGDIEGLRSVDCSGPLQFLLERKLVAFAGRKEAPGRPWLYESTPQFLEAFGLRSLEDLPSLAEWAQLNAESQTQSLFNRGAMQTSEEAHEQTLADEAARVAAEGEAVEEAKPDDAEMEVAETEDVESEEPVTEETADVSPEPAVVAEGSLEAEVTASNETVEEVSPESGDSEDSAITLEHAVNTQEDA